MHRFLASSKKKKALHHDIYWFVCLFVLGGELLKDVENLSLSSSQKSTRRCVPAQSANQVPKTW